MTFNTTALAFALAATLAGSTGAKAWTVDDCTQDCSGHRAGEAWARKWGTTDPARCWNGGGHSWSFKQGCADAAQEAGEPFHAIDRDDEETDEGGW